MLATDLILQKIQKLRSLKETLIVGQDGLLIDAILPPDSDREILSARMLAIFNETNKMFSKMKIGTPKIMVMETDTDIIAIAQIKMGAEVFNVFNSFKQNVDITYIMNFLEEVVASFK